MLWFAIVLALVLVFVALFLPTSITSKLSGVAVGIGMIFTGYGIYVNAQIQKTENKRNQIDRDHKYWMTIFSTFISQPNLRGVYEQMYGIDIPVEEHAMFSMMTQVIESIVEGESLDINKVDGPWRCAIEKWVLHPHFELFWRRNKYEFSVDAQMIIESILRNQ